MNTPKIAKIFDKIVSSLDKPAEFFDYLFCRESSNIFLVVLRVLAFPLGLPICILSEFLAIFFSLLRCILFGFPGTEVDK